MNPKNLVGEFLDITYENAEGRVRDFSIEVIDGWVEDGVAYIEATNLDSDSDLTFRLDRVKSGIPDVEEYASGNTNPSRIIKWALTAVAVLIVLYFLST